MMCKTYLIEFKGTPIIYVFDEDGVISYTPTDTKALGEFFSAGLKMRKDSLPWGVKMDYANAGGYLLKMIYSIAICGSSEELLDYLKKLRDAFASSGLKLKCAEGLLRKYYDDPKRITEEKAMNELKSIHRHGI